MLEKTYKCILFAHDTHYLAELEKRDLEYVVILTDLFAKLFEDLLLILFLLEWKAMDVK